MDRVANRTATAAALQALLLVLPGTPTVYNGDEIAMRDLFIPYAKCQDPMCLKNPRDFASIGRDPERTPMQWDDSNPQAGFSSNPKPWLPVNPDYTAVNVAAESKAGALDTTLQIFSQTAAYREVARPASVPHRCTHCTAY